MKKIRKHNLFFLSLIIMIINISFSSCVGTVKDNNPTQTKSANLPKAPILFAGIDEARPISTDQVEVYFFPAAGEAKDLTYYISYDGFVGQIAIPAISLKRTSFEERYKFTINNLKQGASYNFTVQVKNNKLQATSANTITKAATTISNATCLNFKGAVEVTNLSGSDGFNNLKVRWIKPQISPDQSATTDPQIYEVIALNSGNTIADFDNNNLTPPTRAVVQATSGIEAIIPGLQRGTEYNIRVRCLNKFFVSNSFNPNIYHEQNNNILTKKTLSPGGTDLVANLTSLSSTLLPGVQGLSGANLSWTAVTGPINHLRLYAKKDTNQASAPSFNINLIQNSCTLTDTTPCRKLNFNDTSAVVTGLQAFSTYNVTIAICFTVNCDSNNKKIFSPIFIKTTPSIVNFDGITTIQLPTNNFVNLNSVNLSFNQIDLLTGLFDGFRVNITTETSGVATTKTLYTNDPTADPNHAITFFDSFGHLTSDLKQATSLNITGIDASLIGNYSFSLDPFFIDLSGNKSAPSKPPKTIMITPNKSGSTAINNNAERMLKLPDSNSFHGLTSVSNNISNNTITLSWNPPASGIYNRYIVMWQVGSTFTAQESLTNPNIQTQSINISKTGGIESPYNITIPVLPNTSGSVYVKVFSFSDDYSNIYGDPAEGFSLNNNTAKVVTF